MAASDIDRVLKGVEGLAKLDPVEIGERLDALRVEREMIELKIGVLERLHAEARRRAPRAAEPHLAARVEVPAEKVLPSNGKRPYGWKADAIRGIMTAEPERIWTADEMRERLRGDGFMVGDEGTPTLLLMRRLVQRQQLVEYADDKFGLAQARAGLFADGDGP